MDMSCLWRLVFLLELRLEWGAAASSEPLHVLASFLLKGCFQAGGDGLHHAWRHGIANLGGDFTGISHEYVVIREGLQPCGFAQGNRAVLFRVGKAPPGDIGAAGS